jgi:hypothetical protein
MGVGGKQFKGTQGPESSLSTPPCLGAPPLGLDALAACGFPTLQPFPTTPQPQGSFPLKPGGGVSSQYMAH